MATCDQSKCSTDDSEKLKHVCCSLCLEDGRRIAARHYCVDCEIYYCWKCVKYHNKIPSSKSHHVNDIESSDSTNVDRENRERDDVSTTDILRCLIHHEKQIDTYCKDHDEVCCSTCAVLKHRLCPTQSIDEAAKDFNSSTEVNKSKEALTNVIIRLKHAKAKRAENIDDIDRQKLEMIEAVDQYEENIIKKVKELANISRQEIRSKYEEDKTALDVDCQALDVVMATTTAYVDKLELPGNEPKLFATVKSGNAVSRDGERLLHEMMAEENRELTFYFDKTLQNTVDEMKAFGVRKIKEYKAALQKTVAVQQNTESNTTVCDMCFMDSGDLLQTVRTKCLHRFRRQRVYQNITKLKRFNSDLLFKDEITLKVSDAPVAVCKIDKQEVAVRISGSTTVQLVSVGQSMKSTSLITLDSPGYGMTYDEVTGELYACEDNKVNVYSKQGNKLRTYDEDTYGEPIFTACRQVALSDNNKDIYVTDMESGLIVLDKSGHLKMKVSLSGINDARAVCVLPGNICLAGSESSGVMVQVDKDGKQIGTLINTEDGQTSTWCAAYDPKHSTLIVGGNTGVTIYTLSPR